MEKEDLPSSKYWWLRKDPNLVFKKWLTEKLITFHSWWMGKGRFKPKSIWDRFERAWWKFMCFFTIWCFYLNRIGKL